jgi:hypothetical protein
VYSALIGGTSHQLRAYKENKKMTNKSKVCPCGFCLNSYCVASDSGLIVKNCWCAECKDTRKEIKANAYVMTFSKKVI